MSMVHLGDLGVGAELETSIAVLSVARISL